MRKILTVLFVITVALSGAARGQFCPGVTPWVFDDVPATDPFCGYITYMATAGITTGCFEIDANHRLYCPNDFVTRKQMAAFMTRLRDDLFPRSCSTGQVMKWNGTVWNCAADETGNAAGTVTSIAVGLGLEAIPNPITTTGGMAIAPGYRLPQGCGPNQIPKYIGSTWTCSVDTIGSGTLTSLTQGPGIQLTPSPITSVGSIAIAPAGVTSAELGISAVTESKIATGAVTSQKMADGAVTTAKLDQDSVTAQKLANQSVTFDKLAATNCVHGQVLKYRNSVWACAADDEAIATALAATFIRNRDTALGQLNLTARQVVCATAPSPATNYARTALVRGMANVYAPNGGMDIKAWVVFSTDGGANWTSPSTNDGTAYGALYGGQTPASDLSLYPLNAIDLSLGTEYRFALAMQRVAGSGDVATAYCETLVQMLVPAGIPPPDDRSALVGGASKSDASTRTLQQNDRDEVTSLRREVELLRASYEQEINDLRLAVEMLVARIAGEGRVVQTR